MRKLGTVVLLAFLFVAPPVEAGDGAYEDFARGLSANEMGDSNLALSSFSAALQAGDLSPAYVPAAYQGRARAYLRMRNCSPALSDLTAALKLAPNRIDLVALRAEAAFCSGNLELAESDYGVVIASYPKNFDEHMSRGRVRWRTQNYSGALNDFESAMQIAPKSQYAALWNELVHMRVGTLDVNSAAEISSRFYKDEWPQPLLALIGGRNTPEKVLAIATKSDDKLVQGRLCEANFYIGEWMLSTADQSTAKAFLETAVAHCPKNFIEFDEAQAELDGRR